MPADLNTALTTETRYYTGETNPVDLAVDTSDGIKAGDFVCLKGMTRMVQSVSAAADVATATANFAGIAGQTKEAGVALIRGNSLPNRIRIDTEGTYLVPTSAAAIIPSGELVGLTLVGGKVATQEVIPGVGASLAIGMCVKRKESGETHVRIRIFTKPFSPRAFA